MKLSINILALMILVSNLSLVCAVGQETANQDEVEEESIEKAVDVKLVFQNTTIADVYFQILATADDDDKPVFNSVPIHEDEPLPRNHERTYDSKSGMVWEILNEQKKAIGQYVSGDEPRQDVNINELISWQSKVKINFQNTSEKPIDIYWTSSTGDQVLIIKDMPAGTELKDEPLESMPNQMWTIVQEGYFFADYLPDNQAEQVVDLKYLKTWFVPVEVTFHNATETKLDVYLIDLDGNEVKYTGDEPLMNSKLIQPANPMTLWVLKKGDEVVAEYEATNEKKQECKITEEFLNSDE